MTPPAALDALRVALGGPAIATAFDLSIIPRCAKAGNGSRNRGGSPAPNKGDHITMTGLGRAGP